MGSTPNWDIYYLENGDPQSQITESSVQAGTVEAALDQVAGNVESVNNFGVQYFVNASARDLALTAPAVGWLTQLNSEQFIRRWDGSSWQPYGAAEYPITPTVTGAGVTVGPRGLVAFSGASTISLGNLAGWRSLRVQVVVQSTSTANLLNVRLRSGGTDNTAAEYDWQVGVFNATTASATNSAAQTSWSNLAPAAGSAYTTSLDILDLDEPLITRGTADVSVYSPTAPPIKGIFSLSHRAGTAFDGLTFTTNTGTVTGTLTVAGRPK